VSGNDCYIYKNSIKTSEIGLTEKVGDSSGSERKFELWFRRQVPGVTYILQAASMATKRAWLADISCLLWRQAIRNRERRRSELSQTGRNVASPVISRAGPEFLQDRFIGISLTGGVPRVRNSIAVTSHEHLRSGSKRAHSLVSIDSSSSSGSSGSRLMSLNESLATLGTRVESTVEIQDIPTSTIYTTVSGGLMPLRRQIPASASASIQEDVSTQTTLRRPAHKRFGTSNSRTVDDGQPLLCDSALYTDDDGVPCSDV
jgi:hypothetical protein